MYNAISDLKISRVIFIDKKFTLLFAIIECEHRC